MAILLHRQDNGGHYPAALSDLLADGQIGPEAFICPDADDVPTVLPTATTQQAAAALSDPGHLSYVYFGRAD